MKSINITFQGLSYTQTIDAETLIPALQIMEVFGNKNDNLAGGQRLLEFDQFNIQILMAGPVCV